MWFFKHSESFACLMLAAGPERSLLLIDRSNLREHQNTRLAKMAEKQAWKHVRYADFQGASYSLFYPADQMKTLMELNLFDLLLYMHLLSLS